jgi:hypothetical protein
MTFVPKSYPELIARFSIKIKLVNRKTLINILAPCSSTVSLTSSYEHLCINIFLKYCYQAGRAFSSTPNIKIPKIRAEFSLRY